MGKGLRVGGLGFRVEGFRVGVRGRVGPVGHRSPCHGVLWGFLRYRYTEIPIPLN